MATKSNAPALVDVMTRHQIYLEAVKNHYGAEFDAIVQQLRRDIREIFFDIEVDKLDKLTKRELERFIRRLRTAQIQRFNVYTQQLLNDLKKFTETDAEVNAEIMQETQEEDKPALSALAALLAAAGIGRLWAKVLASTIQANGMTPEQFMERFTEATTFGIETAMRRAHANKMTPQAALALILGTSRLNNRDGILRRATLQANGMTATLLQHAAGIVQAAVASQYFEKYRWVSVLDSRTTDICRSRNGKVYRYGEGPLPPAHVGCRSKTVPVEDATPDIPDSYYDWIKRQPASVQDDVLGKTKADALRAGTAKKTDYDKLSVNSSLTLAKFKDKLKLILAV